MPDAPTPIPLRPSEADRERIARLLCESSLAGRISTETFSDRVDHALRVSDLAALDDLVADVRPVGRLRRAALRAVGAGHG